MVTSKFAFTTCLLWPAYRPNGLQLQSVLAYRNLRAVLP